MSQGRVHALIRQAILDSAGETQQVADELVAAAIDAGAEDDVTAVVIDIQ